MGCVAWWFDFLSTWRHLPALILPVMSPFVTSRIWFLRILPVCYISCLLSSRLTTCLDHPMYHLWMIRHQCLALVYRTVHHAVLGFDLKAVQDEGLPPFPGFSVRLRDCIDHLQTLIALANHNVDRTKHGFPDDFPPAVWQLTQRFLGCFRTDYVSPGPAPYTYLIDFVVHVERFISPLITGNILPRLSLTPEYYMWAEHGLLPVIPMDAFQALQEMDELRP